MAHTGDIRTGRHCVSALHAHSVFVTKFRHEVSTGAHLEHMETITPDVCADSETDLRQFNSETNHVHLLVNFPPKTALSTPVNSHKGVSSRRIHQEYPKLARHYYQANKLWSGSYYAGSVGDAPISALRQYTKQHNQPT